MRLFGVVFLLAFATSAFGQVYKCQDAQGKTEYSNRPCTNTQAAQTVNVSGNRGADATSGPISVGMTRDQVQNIWGKPESFSTTADSEQWTYKRDGKTSYIYFDDLGKVSRVSSYNTPASSSASSTETTRRSTVPTSTLSREAQERADKADARRHITEGLEESGVRNRIGEPDRKDWWNGQECWYYSPTEKDPQSLTRVCFNRNGQVASVSRPVQR